jgi:small ligand-binding sensory domain FIST
MTNSMQWFNALSTRPSLEAAVTEVVDRIKTSFTHPPDLGIVFISSAYASDYPRLVPLILEKFPLPILIGCGGGGIIGMNPLGEAIEIEDALALSLTVARLPEVEVHPFHLQSQQFPDLDSPPHAWTELVDVPAQKNPQFILLCDPFSSQVNDLLEGLDYAYPGCAKIGGLASSSPLDRQTTLFYYDRHQPDYPTLLRQGTVGVALSGNIILETIVAQGCRPVGRPYQISEGERNIILALSELQQNAPSRPPLDVLKDLIETLSDGERQLVQTSLFIGIARDEFKQDLNQGDFLIRNLLGVDPRQGAIAVGDRIRPGQRVQFHLRDAATSALDLELLLEAYCQEKSSRSQPTGALLFSCLGRGQALYEQANFDSQLFYKYIRDIPLSGFFCNGEIGPVGGRTFIHGYTSAFALFRQR